MKTVVGLNRYKVPQYNIASIQSSINAMDGHSRFFFAMVKLPEVGQHAAVFGQRGIVNVNRVKPGNFDQSFFENDRASNGDEEVWIILFDKRVKRRAVQVVAFQDVKAVQFRQLPDRICSGMSGTALGDGSFTPYFLVSILQTHPEKINGAVEVVHLFGKLDG